ncbi:hypothetical protein FEM48_Zijuj01G0184700 [Ziziphus jujuba var. spinosa]|uniref:Prolamin-like domain-containing protein n=1 Tax=Ziziphus jujuba var. spinosa TaxID=714518 RepID=A0A978W2V6_ZIZJJ|nr:lysine-rich arabinogalactan protein 19-like [Ziziphus jujuba var. spinosa]KAH7546290.1 hypothetical protein FEM48_Zijuj01G0184700 [Ziziphus jujuba var. spinosa]
MKFLSFLLLFTICSLSLWTQKGIANECECTCTIDNNVPAYPPSTHAAYPPLTNTITLRPVSSPVNPPSHAPSNLPVHPPSAPAPSPVHKSPPSNMVKSPPPSSPKPPTPPAPHAHQKPGHGILPLPNGPKSCWSSSYTYTICQPQVEAFLHRNYPISVKCCTIIADMGEDCSGPYPHDYRRIKEHCTRLASLHKN